MSIIHDALKKVQEKLATQKTDSPVTSQQEKLNSAYIYDNTPIENLAPAKESTDTPKPFFSNQIKSTLALICALTITVTSMWYLYEQFKNNIPQAQRFAKKSFYQLIHKEEIPDFKLKSTQELQPLAKITINPTTGNIDPNTSNTPITLNIHGIMANASGNLALINDQVYQEGDSVGGTKIVKINLDSITVIINGVEEKIHVKN